MHKRQTLQKKSAGRRRKSCPIKPRTQEENICIATAKTTIRVWTSRPQTSDLIELLPDGLYPQRRLRTNAWIEGTTTVSLCFAVDLGWPPEPTHPVLEWPLRGKNASVPNVSATSMTSEPNASNHPWLHARGESASSSPNNAFLRLIVTGFLVRKFRSPPCEDLVSQVPIYPSKIGIQTTSRFERAFEGRLRAAGYITGGFVRIG